MSSLQNNSTVESLTQLWSDASPTTKAMVKCYTDGNSPTNTIDSPIARSSEHDKTFRTASPDTKEMMRAYGYKPSSITERKRRNAVTFTEEMSNTIFDEMCKHNDQLKNCAKSVSDTPTTGTLSNRMANMNLIEKICAKKYII